MATGWWSGWRMFLWPHIWYNVSRYSFSPNHYLSAPLPASRALSLSPLPLLIYSTWLVFSISSFTLHQTVQPSIQQLHLPHLHPSSAFISDSLETSGWSINAHVALCLKIQKLSGSAFSLPLITLRACFIHACHQTLLYHAEAQGWKLINELNMSSAMIFTSSEPHSGMEASHIAAVSHPTHLACPLLL